MPEAVNSSGRRKVRCPKCTARLTEPPTLIYQCPICATLLLAKGNPDEYNDKSSESKLRGDGREAEIRQQSPEGGPKVERASDIESSIQTQRHREMEYMEDEKMSTKESNRPSRSGYSDETIDNCVFNPMQQDVEEQPLHRRKYHRPKVPLTDVFLRNADSLSTQTSPYTLRWRSSAQSSVKSCESSEKSEQGRFTSGLKSPSYDGSETEDDFPASSSETSNVEELPETTPSINQIEGILLENNSGKSEVREENELNYDRDEIDNSGEALQEASGNGVEPRLELPVLRGSGNDGSYMIGTGELDYNTISGDDMEVHTRDESLVDLCDSHPNHHPSGLADSRQNDILQGPLTAASVRHDSGFGLSLSYESSAKVTACSHTDSSQDCITESRVQNESVADIRNSVCDRNPLRTPESEYHDGLQSELADSGSVVPMVSIGIYKGPTVEQSSTNENSEEPSECRRQQLLGDCARESVSVDNDVIGDGRKQWSKELLSPLSQQAGDRKMEANPCYTEFVTDRMVNTDASDSLEMQFYDRQSVQLSKRNVGYKESCLEAESVDEKRVVDSNMAVAAGVSLKGENDIAFSTLQEVDGLTARFQNQKEDSVIQNQALSCMNESDSSTAIFMSGSGAHVEQPPVKQNISHTGEECTDHMQLYHSIMKSESNISNPTFVKELQSTKPLTSDKIDQSDLAMVVSDKHKTNFSNLALMPPLKIEEIDRKPAPFSWSEKPVRGRHTCFSEDGPLDKKFTLEQGQVGNGAVVQEAALVDPRTFPNMGAGNVLVAGQWPGSFHYLEPNSPGRMTMSDNIEKVSAISRRQKPASGLCVDTHIAGFNPNGNGSHAQHGKYLNHPHSLHGSWQEHDTHLQSPKFQSEQNTMVQGSHCLFCVSANSFQGYSVRCEEGMPQFHPKEQYLSDIQCMSSSTPSGRSYPFQVSSQGVTLPTTVNEHGFGECAHHTIPPGCNFCMKQPQMRQQMQQKPMQHDCATCFSKGTSMMMHQPVLQEGWDSWAHHMVPCSHANSSGGLCQTTLVAPHGIRDYRPDVQFESYASVARKQKRYPPLPVDGAAPYVLCQLCNQLLQVPAYLSPNSESVQKLRCGACGKVSRFSIHGQEKVPSSKMTLATNLIAQARCVPHFVQPSTAYKAYAENSGIHPPAHGPSFPSDNHYGWPPISKATQNAEPPHKQALYGMTDLSSSLVEKKQVSHHTNASARTPVTEQLDHMCHGTLVPGVVEAHELTQSQLGYGDGDSFLGSLGMPSEYYLSSFPSSIGGSSPQGNGRPGSEALGVSNDPCPILSSKTAANFSHLSLQGSLPECHSECSGDEPVSHNQSVLTAESQPQRQSDTSRSTSESSAAQLSKWSAVPGSPLSEHSPEPVGFVPDLNQRPSHQDFGNGVRSAPWSPAPGSPLYDYLLHDASSDLDEKSFQKEQDNERVHANRGRRYLTGLIKRSFRDFGKGSGKGSLGNNNRAKVTVNGRLIQMAAVKKAEEQAGPIHPGSYWYDYRAGFWGPIGGYCLGIIPPFIEEFNYPLAKDCSGGRTGVLVNGRELHQKDLEVLVRRGLPTTPGKAYSVDISGRVVDCASGQHLTSLGKLAPTVERKGRGFGMFQPSVMQFE